MTDIIDDILSGRERLLTAGEVCEILNVNANTLYLWRQSPDVNLPFQRFVAPGQTRGMIRYKYSDVLAFIEQAQTKAEEERQSGLTDSGALKREVVVEFTDEEEMHDFLNRQNTRKTTANANKLEKKRQKVRGLQNKSLAEAITTNSPELGLDDPKEQTKQLVADLLKEFESFGSVPHYKQEEDDD